MGIICEYEGVDNDSTDSGTIKRGRNYNDKEIKTDIRNFACDNSIVFGNGFRECGTAEITHVYFSPGIMNDTNGEIKVDVNMRNFDVAVSKSLGKVCAVTFSFEYDKQQFDILTDEGLPKIILDNNTLVKNKDDIESKFDDNFITFTFMDSTSQG